MKTPAPLRPRLSTTTNLLAAGALLLVAAGAGLKPAQLALTAVSPVAAYAADWETRNAKEVSLEAPGALTDNPDAIKDLPETLRSKLEAYNFAMAEDGEDFVVAVTRIAYKPDVDPSLQGATEGGISEAAKSLGDAKPKYDVSETKAGALDARRATYKGKDWQIESFVAQKDKTIFQIQVICNPKRGADADRVIKSIKIAAE